MNCEMCGNNHCRTDVIKVPDLVLAILCAACRVQLDRWLMDQPGWDEHIRRGHQWQAHLAALYGGHDSVADSYVLTFLKESQQCQASLRKEILSYIAEARAQNDKAKKEQT